LFAAAHAAADDLCGRLEPSRNGSSREVLYAGKDHTCTRPIVRELSFRLRKKLG
jgi:hypothetical protein